MTPLDDCDDSQLIDSARDGNLAAFDELVRRYQTVAFRTAWLITGNAADAEDVAQDAFVKAWRALDRFDRQRGLRALARRSGQATGEFRPWLLTIVANEARNRRRSVGRRRESPFDPAVFDLQASGESPSTVIERQTDAEGLVSALNALPERDRLAIELRYVLDLNEAEMAAVLGVERGTVKSRLSRALTRLRASLEAGELDP